jgi:hypothetical protein
MKDQRLLRGLMLQTLAGVVLLAGCSKTSNPAPAGSVTPDNTAQPQASNPPAPPADQSGTPPATSPSANAPAPPPPPPSSLAGAPSSAPAAPATIVIPRGTDLRVRLDQDLGSKISHAGDSFAATVADDVVVDGQTVIPRHARAEGTVVDAKPLGHFKGGALLQLRLERVRTQWGSYPVATSTMDRVEKGKGKRTGLFAGGGGAFGALVGGLAGGGKGALIGGLAGAGAGTAGSAMTGNQQIFLPAETLLTFRLEHPVHVTQ